MGRMYKHLRDFQGDDWAGSPAARDPELAPWVPYLMQMFRPEEGAYLMPYDQPQELDEGWTSKEGQSWETKAFGDARAASDGDAVARGDARQQAVEGISKDVLHPFPEAAALLETPPDQLSKEGKEVVGKLRYLLDHQLYLSLYSMLTSAPLPMRGPASGKAQGPPPAFKVDVSDGAAPAPRDGKHNQAAVLSYSSSEQSGHAQTRQDILALPYHETHTSSSLQQGTTAPQGGMEHEALWLPSNRDGCGSGAGTTGSPDVEMSKPGSAMGSPAGVRDIDVSNVPRSGNIETQESSGTVAGVVPSSNGLSISEAAEATPTTSEAACSANKAAAMEGMSTTAAPTDVEPASARDYGAWAASCDARAGEPKEAGLVGTKATAKGYSGNDRDQSSMGSGGSQAGPKDADCSPEGGLGRSWGTEAAGHAGWALAAERERCVVTSWPDDVACDDDGAMETDDGVEEALGWALGKEPVRCTVTPVPALSGFEGPLRSHLAVKSA